MLWKTNSDQPRVREYTRFCADPIGRFQDVFGDDVNRDGKLDLGKVLEGYYEYTCGSTSKFRKALIPRQNMMSKRDINRDGKFTENEPISSALDSILFHPGNSSNDTGSAGCQTLHPDDFGKFWNDLRSNGDPGVIGYTLVRRA